MNFFRYDYIKIVIIIIIFVKSSSKVIFYL